MLFGYNVCFLFSNKKGPPNNQPEATDRKAAPENFPREEFQKLPGLQQAPLCWLQASDRQRRPRLASPEYQPSFRFTKAWIGKHYQERFTDLNCWTGKTFRIYRRNLKVLGCRGNSSFQMRVYTSILPHQRALGPSHSLLPLPPPIAPHTLSLRRGPRSFLLSSSLRHSPTCTSYPVPHHPDIRVGVPPHSPFTLSPYSLWLRRRTGNQSRARLRVRPGGAGSWRAGRGWEKRLALHPDRRGARPARGSARSSPAASKSGRATAKSPTFLEPLESHLSGGGWGVFFK